MKTIFLLRHSEPERLAGVPHDQWPLSERGRQLAQALLAKAEFNAAARVYASPLTRALETAQYAGLPVQVDDRLKERLPGQATPEMGDCWLRQYQDHEFKCPGGESFDEVCRRMSACVDGILSAMAEEEQAVIVTHAAAICAYLTRYCTVRVVDRAGKVRSIELAGRTVYTGSIPAPCAFRLSFQQGNLTDIALIE